MGISERSRWLCALLWWFGLPKQTRDVVGLLLADGRCLNFIRTKSECRRTRTVEERFGLVAPFSLYCPDTLIKNHELFFFVFFIFHARHCLVYRMKCTRQCVMFYFKLSNLHVRHWLIDWNPQIYDKKIYPTFCLINFGNTPYIITKINQNVYILPLIDTKSETASRNLACGEPFESPNGTTTTTLLLNYSGYLWLSQIYLPGPPDFVMQNGKILGKNTSRRVGKSPLLLFSLWGVFRAV